jgi:hypothetical protein
MKRCPTCQQTYPDPGPDFCANDGTRLITDAPQQQYYAGNQPPPYGTPNDPSQWQQPPGGYYPQPPSQQPPGLYPPPPPYGGQYASVAGSKALSSAAFLCGLGSFIILVLIIVLYSLARNGAFNFDTLLTLASIMRPLSWLMLLAAVASIVLGIMALVTGGRNPAISKPKAIVGMCLGAIPLLLFFIGLANMPG